MADVSHSHHVRSAARTAAAPRRAARPAPAGRRGAHGTRATIEDWLRIPEEKRAELIRGQIVYHAFPGIKHGDTQAQISRSLYPYRRRRTGGGERGGGDLGGWWLSQEVDMAIADIGCRPDVVGWRRDKHARVPEPDSRGVITVIPDFICEVLSSSTARYDQVEKCEAYYEAGVPYYWLVDPVLRTLTVLERTDRGYLLKLVAGPGQRVRAAPFEGVEIFMDELFMDEEGEVSTAESAEPGPARARQKEATAKRRVATALAPPKKRAPRRKG